MSIPLLDAIVISDLHLGSAVCQARHISDFLTDIADGRLRTQRLILNGDIFDTIDFRRLSPEHWQIFSLLRRLAFEITVIWLAGNHDGPLGQISHLLGIEVKAEYSFKSGEESVLVLHGDIFDDFIDTHPRITFLADAGYRFLQWIDRSHRFARYAKRNSKLFLRCIGKIRDGAISRAELGQYSVVCCGHTHHPEVRTDGPVRYYNSGSWTEHPCTYISVTDGVVRLEAFMPDFVASPYRLDSSLDPEIAFA